MSRFISAKLKSDSESDSEAESKSDTKLMAKLESNWLQMRHLLLIIFTHNFYP